MVVVCFAPGLGHEHGWQVYALSPGWVLNILHQILGWTCAHMGASHASFEYAQGYASQPNTRNDTQVSLVDGHGGSCDIVRRAVMPMRVSPRRGNLDFHGAAPFGVQAFV